MKVIWAAVLMLLLSLTCLAESTNNQVWGSGSVIYGQGTLGNALMNTHTLTTKVRFVNTATGVGTAWVTKTTYNGATNVNKISISNPRTPTAYRMEVQYDVHCPQGRYNSSSMLSTLFTIGYSLNCLHIVSGTTQKDIYGNWYALYSKTPGCAAHCLVNDRIGFTTSGAKIGPDLYVQMRYWYLSVFWGSTYCLDAFEANRNACSSCGDYAQ